ncbi:MAG: guanosine monophosphate reductase [Deltaproteobacteria bacterium]|nr:guanosine monophosphate reductase [Deltaproteobacteria bacterium]
MRKAFTFDDVALVPQFNNIPSRLEPTLESWLTKDIKMHMPILAANMDTVMCDDLADIIITNGSVPIFHRFTGLETQKTWIKKYGKKMFISCGILNIGEIQELLDLGPAGVCVDIAHGHSDRMMKFIEEIKTSHPDIEVIAGNVCTPMAYHDLVNAGADAVKVGVGPGAACTTRIVTGFGVPQFTAIKECASIADKLRVPMIADGGIRNSRDLVLALAAGASSVMIGKLFALTKESAAPKREAKNLAGLEAKYRGQASEDFQVDYYGNVKKDTVPEGINFWAPVSGTAQELINNLLGGLRSGLTYGGARSIKELQRKAEFVEVTHSYMTESNPRQ